ncbi:hypothetical protein EJ08DRAFT_735413 [Tothia fuscella]|uniref:Uncharacterized protein n=1 Tax=Tothia fuscella TaxID=1048955 RepID=A0A9P4TXH5_9PEZI|nr:hypothetical protein EJ08DRAFT_735413 [Tothia fuscella]
MPIIKNPFKKSAAPLEIQENSGWEAAEGGFQQTNVQGAKPVEMREPVEYEFSEISDNGVYLHPPPPEKKNYFSRSSTATSNSTRSSELSENEPFSISRESFDSYRRSFDISARSPIPSYEPPTRQSLDSRRGLQPLPLRSSFQGSRIDRPYAPVEEGFEEVGLHDEVKPKKRGLFARFGDSADSSVPSSPDARPTSSHLNFFTGRKRGQSGQGAELRSIDKPIKSAAEVES